MATTTTVTVRLGSGRDVIYFPSKTFVRLRDTVSGTTYAGTSTVDGDGGATILAVPFAPPVAYYTEISPTGTGSWTIVDPTTVSAYPFSASAGTLTLTGPKLAPFTLVNATDEFFASNPPSSGNGKPIDQGGHFYSLLAYGAVGNGVANDDAAWTAAYAAVPAGGTIFMPAGYNFARTAASTISKSLNVQLDGQMTQATTNTQGFIVNASSVRVYGSGSLVGPQFASYQPNERALDIFGASMAAALLDITIETININNWGAYGVRPKYAKNVRCFRLTQRNIYYGAIVFLSVIGFICSMNYINNVPGIVAGSAYGIADGRDGNIDSLVTDPQCSDGVYVGNIIINVTNWEGLDTHGGIRHTITGNTVEGCQIGINVGSCKNGSGVEQFPPVQITLTGNTLDSLKTDGTALYGIAFGGPAGNGVGSRTYAPLTGAATGNVIKGYGDSTNDHSGAIYAHDTQGLALTGNAIYAPSPHGICLYYNNWAFLVSGNVVTDPWTNNVAVGHATAVIAVSQYNQGLIDGLNSDTTGGVSATYLLTEGVHVLNDATNVITLGIQKTTAATPLYDAGARVTCQAPAGTLITANGTWTVPLTGTYRIIAVGSGGGAGGGGSSLSAGGTATQVGGAGGAAGMTAETVVVGVAAGTVLTVTIGAVGTGGTGGIVNGNVGGNGISGGNTTVSGTGIALTATGGGLGIGGGANSATTVNGGQWGAPGNTTSLQGVGNGGTASSTTGARGGAAQGLAGGGGSGGANASASFGGVAGNGGPANGQSVAVSGQGGTVNGATGNNGAGYGAGGGGGGGGAPTGTGGNGGNGSAGVVAVMKIA